MKNRWVQAYLLMLIFVGPLAWIAFHGDGWVVVTAAVLLSPIAMVLGLAAPVLVALAVTGIASTKTFQGLGADIDGFWRWISGSRADKDED